MRYDGFISYSHSADHDLAPALQDGLQRLGKPWYRRRELNIFRDETGLSTNPALWTPIMEKLDESRYFIWLASPESAKSEWVERELQHWLRTKTAARQRILPVLTSGALVWDHARGDFDPVKSTALPAALLGVFTEAPRYTDLTWAHGQEHLQLRHAPFRAAVADVAAPLHGMSKDEFESADIRRHRRALQLALGVILLLLLLALGTGVAGWMAVRNADAAKRNAQQALAEKTRADANATRARRNAATARDNETRAKDNAKEASRQRDLATSNEATAKRNETIASEQRDLAAQNASEAARQRDNAAVNAAEAIAQKFVADQNAAEALLQQQIAEQNATEALRQQQIAAEQAQIALENAQTALSRQLAAQALTTLATATTAPAAIPDIAVVGIDDPTPAVSGDAAALALLLAVEAERVAPTTQAHDALLRALQARGAQPSEFGSSDGNFWGDDPVVSPDGRTVAVESVLGVRLFDQEGTVLPSPTGPWVPGSGVFSADGSRLAYAGWNDNTVHVWDRHARCEVLTVGGRHDVVALSPDGAWVATVTNGTDGPGDRITVSPVPAPAVDCAEVPGNAVAPTVVRSIPLPTGPASPVLRSVSALALTDGATKVAATGSNVGWDQFSPADPDLRGEDLSTFVWPTGISGGVPPVDPAALVDPSVVIAHSATAPASIEDTLSTRALPVRRLAFTGTDAAPTLTQLAPGADTHSFAVWPLDGAANDPDPVLSIDDARLADVHLPDWRLTDLGLAGAWGALEHPQSPMVWIVPLTGGVVGPTTGPLLDADIPLRCDPVALSCKATVPRGVGFVGDTDPSLLATTAGRLVRFDVPAVPPLVTRTLIGVALGSDAPVGLAADAEVVASVAPDGHTVRLVRTGDGAPVAERLLDGDAVTGADTIAVGPDDRTVAVQRRTSVVLWDAGSDRLTVIPTADDDPGGVAFSPDGALLAVAFHGSLRLYDVASGAPRTVQPAIPVPTSPLDPLPAYASPTFTPDGAQVVVAMTDTIRLFDVGSGAVSRSISVGSLTWDSGAFTVVRRPLLVVSPDQRLVVIAKERMLFPPTVSACGGGSVDGTLQAVDLVRNAVVTIDEGNHCRSAAVAFAHGSGIAAAVRRDAGGGLALSLWDTTVGSPVGRAVPLPATDAIAFTESDAQVRAVGVGTEVVTSFDVAFRDSLIAMACAAAGRDLTAVERGQFLGDQAATAPAACPAGAP